jgi:exonuclease SbcD
VKILHTSDWHMNETLGRVDRSGDICHALEQIARYLDEHEVDVMLATGDLFSERSRPEQMRAAIGKIREIFLPFLSRGGTIVAISGNHDNEVFFETVRDALDLAAPAGDAPADGIAPSGRFYITSDPQVLRLRDDEGLVVQFVLMPYPTARAYLRGDATRYRTIEEKHTAIQEAFTTTLYNFFMKLDPALPNVLVGHVHVRGVSVHTLYKISESEDVVFEPGNIPTNWSYVAYGHIHKPQAVFASAEHVRYAGSIERMDVAERDDTKSVVLVDVTRRGPADPPRLLPLESTPIYAVEISDPAEISALAGRYSDRERALVSYTLHWEPGRDDRDALARAVQEIFPRWYARHFVEIGHERRLETAPSIERVHDVAANVHEYLAENSPPDIRAALVEAADALLAETEEARG